MQSGPSTSTLPMPPLAAVSTASTSTSTDSPTDSTIAASLVPPTPSVSSGEYFVDTTSSSTGSVSALPTSDPLNVLTPMKSAPASSMHVASELSRALRNLIGAVRTSLSADGVVSTTLERAVDDAQRVHDIAVKRRRESDPLDDHQSQDSDSDGVNSAGSGDYAVTPHREHNNMNGGYDDVIQATAVVMSCSKLPIKILYVPVQRQFTLTRRETKGMSPDQREELVNVSVRIMGTSRRDHLYFVAKDICQLICLRKGSVAKAIHDFSDREKARMPVMCQRSSGNGCTQVLTVLTIDGVKRLMSTSRQPIAKYVLSWIVNQCALIQSGKDDASTTDTFPTIINTDNTGSIGTVRHSRTSSAAPASSTASVSTTSGETAKSKVSPARVSHGGDDMASTMMTTAPVTSQAVGVTTEISTVAVAAGHRAELSNVQRQMPMNTFTQPQYSVAPPQSLTMTQLPHNIPIMPQQQHAMPPPQSTYYFQQHMQQVRPQQSMYPFFPTPPQPHPQPPHQQYQHNMAHTQHSLMQQQQQQLQQQDMQHNQQFQTYARQPQ